MLVIDDFNLLNEESDTGRFLTSMITLGHYYDSCNNVVRLDNYSIVAAETSLTEFALSRTLVSHFKIIEVPPLDLNTVSKMYVERIEAGEISQICQDVVALHDFVKVLD